MGAGRFAITGQPLGQSLRSQWTPVFKKAWKIFSDREQGEGVARNLGLSLGVSGFVHPPSLP